MNPNLEPSEIAMKAAREQPCELCKTGIDRAHGKVGPAKWTHIRGNYSWQHPLEQDRMMSIRCTSPGYIEWCESRKHGGEVSLADAFSAGISWQAALDSSELAEARDSIKSSGEYPETFTLAECIESLIAQKQSAENSCKELAEALQLADKAMNHMGDVLNGMDCVMPEDEPYFDAFEKVQSALANYLAMKEK